MLLKRKEKQEHSKANDTSSKTVKKEHKSHSKSSTTADSSKKTPSSPSKHHSHLKIPHLHTPHVEDTHKHSSTKKNVKSDTDTEKLNTSISKSGTNNHKKHLPHIHISKKTDSDVIDNNNNKTKNANTTTTNNLKEENNTIDNSKPNRSFSFKSSIFGRTRSNSNNNNNKDTITAPSPKFRNSIDSVLKNNSKKKNLPKTRNSLDNSYSTEKKNTNSTNSTTMKSNKLKNSNQSLNTAMTSTADTPNTNTIKTSNEKITNSKPKIQPTNNVIATKGIQQNKTATTISKGKISKSGSINLNNKNNYKAVSTETNSKKTKNSIINNLKILSSVNKIEVNNLYPWRSVASFNADGRGVIDKVRAHDIHAYIKGTFYNDIYINVSPIFVTCFFAWLFAYLGFSWLALGIVFCFTITTYHNEYRRFNRNIRDDLKRAIMHSTLENKAESIQWLNSFLKKFWVIFTPVMSTDFRGWLNNMLASMNSEGLDNMELTEFTVGSKAPSVHGILTHSIDGKKRISYDMNLEFTPNDIGSMTVKEIHSKVDPRIVLALTFRKGPISKDLKVILENLNVTAKARVEFIFSNVYPNIKSFSFQFLEPPVINFALKPLGGDALGLDVMSALPGFKDTVQGSINGILGPMMYAPNKYIIDMEEWMSAQGNDAIGVLMITISSASGLKSSDFITNTVDPYIIFNLEKKLNDQDEDQRTSTKEDTKEPRWDETYYILLNDLKQTLTLTMFDYNDVRVDTLIGTLEIDLMELLEATTTNDRQGTLTKGAKARGVLHYSLAWYPVITTGRDIVSHSTGEDNVEVTKMPTVTQLDTSEAAELGLDGERHADDDGIENGDRGGDSDVGIAKISLNSIRNLNTSLVASGRLNPSATLYIDDVVVKKFRTLKGINEPSWGETVEAFVSSRENAQLKLTVFHEGSSSRKVIAEYNGSLDDMLSSYGADTESFKAIPLGDIYMPIQWKPIAMEESAISNNREVNDIGAIRLLLKEINIVSSLDGFGDIDPYYKVYVNKRLLFVSRYHSDNSNPQFNDKVYLPIKTENQTITIEVYDFQSVGKDRLAGLVRIPVSGLIKRDKISGTYRTTKIPAPLSKLKLGLLDGSQSESYINCSFAFIPVRKVFSPEEYVNVVELEQELKEKKAKFEKKQNELKEMMDSNPNDWEIVKVTDPFFDDEKKITRKMKMSLKELVHCNSGILTFRVFDGRLSEPSSYLQILVDDIIFPTYTSLKTQHGKLIGEIGSVFIRDLNNSILTFRVTRSYIVKEPTDVISEMTLETSKFFAAGYDKPITLDWEGNTFDMRFLYNPTVSPLPISEGVEDTGYLDLDIVSAAGLLSADRNGKSDPYIVIIVNDKHVYKSHIIQKTLDPVWNEHTQIYIPSRTTSDIIVQAWDWDRLGSNDPLGNFKLNLSKMDISQENEWNSKLSTQGTVLLRGKFTPQFATPSIEQDAAAAVAAPMRSDSYHKSSHLPVPAAMVVGGITGAFGVVAKTGEFIIHTIDGKVVKMIIHPESRNTSSVSLFDKHDASTKKRIIHGDEDFDDLTSYNEDTLQAVFKGEHIKGNLKGLKDRVHKHEHLSSIKAHGIDGMKKLGEHDHLKIYSNTGKRMVSHIEGGIKNVGNELKHKSESVRPTSKK